MGVVNFLANNVVFSALNSMLFLYGKAGSEEDLVYFVDMLEQGIERLSEGNMGDRSSEVLYQTLEKYLGNNFEREYCLDEAREIVGRLRMYNDLENEERRNLGDFCRYFHEASISARQKVIPEIEKVLGKLE